MQSQKREMRGTRGMDWLLGSLDGLLLGYLRGWLVVGGQLIGCRNNSRDAMGEKDMPKFNVCCSLSF